MQKDKSLFLHIKQFKPIKKFQVGFMYLLNPIGEKKNIYFNSKTWFPDPIEKIVCPFSQYNSLALYHDYNFSTIWASIRNHLFETDFNEITLS